MTGMPCHSATLYPSTQLSGKCRVTDLIDSTSTSARVKVKDVGPVTDRVIDAAATVQRAISDAVSWVEPGGWAVVLVALALLGRRLRPSSPEAADRAGGSTLAARSQRR